MSEYAAQNNDSFTAKMRARRLSRAARRPPADGTSR